MKTNLEPSLKKSFACETGPTRKKAGANPKTLMRRLGHSDRSRILVSQTL